MARPISGSARSKPRATRAALRDDAERDVAVGAGVVAVRDQCRGWRVGVRRAIAPERRSRFLGSRSHRPLRAPRGESDALRVDEPLDRLVEGHASRDEDRGDDDRGQRSSPDAVGAQAKNATPERDRGERVAEVVDQVGQQRDRTRQREDGRPAPPPRLPSTARLVETAVRTPSRRAHDRSGLRARASAQARRARARARDYGADRGDGNRSCGSSTRCERHGRHEVSMGCGVGVAVDAAAVPGALGQTPPRASRATRSRPHERAFHSRH